MCASAISILIFTMFRSERTQAWNFSRGTNHWFSNGLLITLGHGIITRCDAGIRGTTKNNRDKDNYEDFISEMFYEGCVHKLLYSISGEFTPDLCLAVRNYILRVRRKYNLVGDDTNIFYLKDDSNIYVMSFVQNTKKYLSLNKIQRNIS